MSWHGETPDSHDGRCADDEHDDETRDARAACRVVMPGERGPVLVQGPVEIVLDDGSTVRSERPVVALCACGRSLRHPFCDTSHRRRSARPIR